MTTVPPDGYSLSQGVTVKKERRPASDVDTGGSDPEGSDISTLNSETDISGFQNNSPAPEQMIASASDSGPDP